MRHGDILSDLLPWEISLFPQTPPRSVPPAGVRARLAFANLESPSFLAWAAICFPAQHPPTKDLVAQFFRLSCSTLTILHPPRASRQSWESTAAGRGNCICMALQIPKPLTAPPMVADMGMDKDSTAPLICNCTVVFFDGQP